MSAFYKTEVCISKKAIRNNIKIFRNHIGRNVKFLAVVKSNAYGHGLVPFSKFAEPYVDWFGVDSVAEALSLRKNGVKKRILVLGYTLPSRYKEAEKKNITLSFFNKEELSVLKKYSKLKVHLKIDTGMHRQGIYVHELDSFIQEMNPNQLNGMYTHFAGPKDKKFRSYTILQIEQFKKAVQIADKRKLKIVKHVCGTAGALNYRNAHFDMVRIGGGMYGMSMNAPYAFGTKPILSWTSVLAQIKKVKKGSYIGYDLTERLKIDSEIGLVPIGYWHGVQRGLSKIGEVLIRGKRCKILGIISMDVLVVALPKKIGAK